MDEMDGWMYVVVLIYICMYIWAREVGLLETGRDEARRER